MRAKDPFQKVLALILGLYSLGSVLCGTAQAQGQPQQTGYFAEVVDKSGNKMTVNSFSFGYTYSYTRSNCIGACGTSGADALYFLALNDACGAWMVPIAELKSISGISQPAYNVPVTATITFSDGHTAKSKFGRFGGSAQLYRVQGKSALGEYSLDISKVMTVTFLHERDVLPLPHEKFGADDSKAA